MRPRTLKHHIDLLKGVPLFSECSQRELRAIAQLGTPMKVDKGRVLIKKGAVGREFFLVTSRQQSSKRPTTVKYNPPER